MSNIIVENSTNFSTEVKPTEVKPTEAKSTPITPPIITSTLITPPSGPSVEVDGQTVLYPMPTPSTAPAPSTGLPDGYLDGGSMMDADGILRPEYLKEYAQQLAELLKPMKAAAFHKAFIKEPKKFQKPKASDGAKKLCAAGLAVEARTLVGCKKAPAVLLPLIEAVTDTVQDAATFDALCRHLAAIYSYLL